MNTETPEKNVKVDLSNNWGLLKTPQMAICDRAKSVSHTLQAYTSLSIRL